MDILPKHPKEQSRQPKKLANVQKYQGIGYRRPSALAGTIVQATLERHRSVAAEATRCSDQSSVLVGDKYASTTLSIVRVVMAKIAVKAVRV